MKTIFKGIKARTIMETTKIGLGKQIGVGKEMVIGSEKIIIKIKVDIMFHQGILMFILEIKV